MGWRAWSYDHRYRSFLNPSLKLNWPPDCAVTLFLLLSSFFPSEFLHVYCFSEVKFLNVVVKRCRHHKNWCTKRMVLVILDWNQGQMMLQVWFLYGLWVKKKTGRPSICKLQSVTFSELHSSTIQWGDDAKSERHERKLCVTDGVML